MLKFIDPTDFLKVDTFRENEDGSVSWLWDEGVDLPTHSGNIFEGLTRTTQIQEGTKSVQIGTETVVVGQEPVVDEEGNPLYEQVPVLDEEGNPLLDEEGEPITENGEPLMQDITEEHPVYEDQPNMVDTEIDVWAKLWELHNDDSIEVTVLPVDLDIIRERAKQIVNAQRDSLISGGVVHNGYTFQTDPTSIMDIMGAIMSGIDTTWLTADNQQVPMTNAEMQALGGAVAAHKETLVFKARVHKDNIESLLTKADIEDYVTNLSWD